ncbi:peptidase M23 [Halalkalibacillus sediminis]|uniref:Peptidase M23 n=1 Tax=Halalkalibacillus sediminis TaxID=2018042 RepID=A0A2I0QUS0_9BACI|nr:M23 family metallopeptidase [Halalkalibacillus sediminis]PKR78097.1 peptidase M23 [Halalkalibacillus sediminis]
MKTMLMLVIFLLPVTFVSAEENEHQVRQSLYEKIEATTGLPWNYIAAMDQYERNINGTEDNRWTGIRIPNEKWYGLLSAAPEQPFREEQLDLFNGLGKDGDGDGIANHKNDEDALYTAALIIMESQSQVGSFKAAIQEYYEREKAGELITQYAKLFQHFGTIELDERAFPIPKHQQYSYRSTWGDRRGFGGNRIHEGTDLFAHYGTPVRSVSYGIVEIKGWNRFGGWRIGIRDMYNIYHYYAHLNGFADGIEEGSFVKPGDLIGSVGASGYGPEGTAGKFPPHLHYGMYKDNGKNEWAYDPYPYLKRWERQE